MRQFRRPRLLLLVSSLFFSVLIQAAPASAESKLDGRLRFLQGASRQQMRMVAPGTHLDTQTPIPTVGVLIKLAAGAHIADLRAAHPNVDFHTEVGRIVTAMVPVSELAAFESDPNIEGAQVSRRNHPTLDVVRSLQTSGGNYLGILEASPDLAVADGTGIVVGDVDTGIYYAHPDFRNSDNSTRIISIWDQGTAGVKPPGFGYGNECLPGAPGRDITSGTCTEKDANSGAPGHGTHVSGIMAGNGRGTGNSIAPGRYTGIAKNARIIMVASDKLSDVEIIDGVNYIVGKAQALGTRAVINLSLGTQMSPHDGTSFLEQGIDAVAASTPVVVAMGNDNGGNPHTQFTVPSGLTVRSVMNTCTSGFGCYGSYGRSYVEAEYWLPSADFYNVSVTVDGPGGGTANYTAANFGTTINLPGVPISCNGNNFTSGFFVLVTTGTNGAGGSLSATDIDVVANDGGMSQAFGCSMGNVEIQLTRVSAGGSGLVDGYTESEGGGTSFGNFISPNGTMNSPASANNVFAVASYNTKNSWPMDSTNASGFDPATSCGTGNRGYGAPIPAVGQISNFSGAGPTRDGRQKPDVAAPGQGIASTLSHDINPAAFLPPNTVQQPACFAVDDSSHVIDQGTSMATPVVTGVIAVMLQVNPNLTIAQIRSALTATARVDGGVTANGAAPNYFWGAGKVVAAPTKVRVQPVGQSFQVLGTSSITFTWSAANNATSYNLYNSLPPNNFLQTVTILSSTTLNLPPNTLYGVTGKGVNGYGEGPGSSFFVASTLANPPVFGSAQPWVSSVTINFLPGAGGAQGFTVYASTDPTTYNGTVFSSATSNGAVRSLTISGLSPATQYFLRMGALNQSSVESDALAGSATTINPYVAPPIVVAPAPSQNQFQFFWTQGANPSSLNYSADCSTTPAFTGSADQNQQGIDMFTAVFPGLIPNTSYYFRVKANVSVYSSTGPVATLAAAPLAAAPAYSAVAANAFNVLWSSGTDPIGTFYLVQASSTGFVPGNALVSSATFNASAALAGLNSNTLYAAQVQAFNRIGIPTGFTALGSTLTLAAPPAVLAPLSAAFTNQVSTGFTVNYTNGGNGPGTQFLVQVSTDPTAAFYPVAASSLTLNTFASFSGLVPNTPYNFRAGALNTGGVSYSPNSFAVLGVSTYTAPSAPAPAGPPVDSSTGSLHFSWDVSANAAGTRSTAQASPDPAFGFGNVTLANTPNNFADVGGLLSNTTYYFRAQALHDPASTNPDSAFTSLGAASTLAKAPAFAPTVLPVGLTSVSVSFTACPGGCEGYQMQASADPAFAAVVFSSNVSSSQLTAGVTGLLPATTYYVRVGALNWNSISSFSAVATTGTLIPIQSVGTVGTGGLNLTVVPGLGLAIKSIQLLVPPFAIAPGTLVTLNTSVQQNFPPPISNEANMTLLGNALGFSIDAQGNQPAATVQAVVSYDPLLIPVGQSARNIQLARYDTASAQWTLLPTSVDTSQNTATAQLNHFSLFAPFLVQAGSDLGSINIFPVPWEPLSSNALFNAPVITFSNLPPVAHVRVLTLRGELLWEADANSAGVLTWDGKNRYARNAGSGTFLVTVESGGQHVVKRVVLIR